MGEIHSELVDIKMLVGQAELFQMLTWRFF